MFFTLGALFFIFCRPIRRCRLGISELDSHTSTSSSFMNITFSFRQLSPRMNLWVWSSVSYLKIRAGKRSQRSKIMMLTFLSISILPPNTLGKMCPLPKFSPTKSIYFLQSSKTSLQRLVSVWVILPSFVISIASGEDSNMLRVKSSSFATFLFLKLLNWGVSIDLLSPSHKFFNANFCNPEESIPKLVQLPWVRRHQLAT